MFLASLFTSQLWFLVSATKIDVEHCETLTLRHWHGLCSLVAFSWVCCVPRSCRAHATRNSEAVRVNRIASWDRSWAILFCFLMQFTCLEVWKRRKFVDNSIIRSRRVIKWENPISELEKVHNKSRNNKKKVLIKKIQSEERKRGKK